MSILKKMVRPIKIAVLPVLAALVLVGCSEEKKEPLPELPPVEIPKDLTGLYSGRLPCDDCTARMIRMTLAEDNSVEVVQTVVKDSLEVDTLKGTFSVGDSTIKVELTDKSIHWTFLRGKFGNLSYMTSAGTVYEDKDGMRAELIKIFKVAPVKRTAVKEDSLKQDSLEKDSLKE